MKFLKPDPQQIKSRLLLLTAIGLVTAEFLSLFPDNPNLWNPQAFAQTLSNIESASFQPPPPPDVGSPTERRAAASRNRSAGCPTLSDSVPSVTSLVPVYRLAEAGQAPPSYTLNSESTRSEGNVIYGTTIEAYPTLWMYSPYDITPERPGVLLLETSEKEFLTLQTYTDLPAGAVSLPLEDTSLPPLAIGEQHNFVFVLQCNPRAWDENLYVSFTVHRIAPNGAETDNNTATTSLEQAIALGQAGVWYDFLNTLFLLHKEAPNDAVVATSLCSALTSVGLQDVAQLSTCNALTEL